VSFAFHMDLFEHRAKAMEKLEAADIQWLRDYSSVDLGHEEHAIEVCGIADEATARRIQAVIASAFAGAKSRYWFKDFGIEIGWKVEVFIPLRHIP
jgi:hypothetical protein